MAVLYIKKILYMFLYIKCIFFKFVTNREDRLVY